MWAHHTGTATSVGQISSAVRPEGKVIWTARGSRGRPWAPASGRTRRRLRSCGPVASCMPVRTPEVQRSRAVGRSRRARISPSPGGGEVLRHHQLGDLGRASVVS